MTPSDRDRDRVVGLLRERYARGQLTVDELSERADAALRARSRGELLGVLGADDLLRHGRGVVSAVTRAALLVVCTGAYVLFTVGLLLVLVLTALIHGASAAVLLGFAVVWLIPTYLLARLWHRPRPRGPSHV